MAYKGASSQLGPFAQADRHLAVALDSYATRQRAAWLKVRLLKCESS